LVPHELARATATELAQGFHYVFLITGGFALAGAVVGLGIRSEPRLAATPGH
jgi:hypothetical protein